MLIRDYHELVTSVSRIGIQQFVGQCKLVFTQCVHAHQAVTVANVFTGLDLGDPAQVVQVVSGTQTVGVYVVGVRTLRGVVQAAVVGVHGEGQFQSINVIDRGQLVRIGFVATRFFVTVDLNGCSQTQAAE